MTRSDDRTLVPTVVHILSSNRSGSTWLALMLGSHSQGMYLGELNKMYRGSPWPCRFCEVRGNQCSIFHDVSSIPPEHVHEHLSKRCGKPVLIDNSKRVSWCKKSGSREDKRAKYIHLLRDPRGTLYSLLKRNRPANLDNWIHENQKIHRFLTKHELDFRLVLYSDLATRSKETLHDLTHWIGIPFESSQIEYWNFEHHGAGRSSATVPVIQRHNSPDWIPYRFTRRGSHDQKWRKGLTADLQKAIAYDPKVTGLLRDFDLRLSDSGLENLRQ